MVNIVGEHIIKEVCRIFEVTRDDLLSPSRKKKIALVRQVTMKLLRDQGWSLKSIAEFLNRKDHTTVIHALKKKSIIELADKVGIVPFDIHDTRILYPSKTKYHHKYSWLFKIYPPKCMVCGFDDVVEIHHIVSPKAGGTDDPSNLLILCPNHHSMLHAGLIKIKDIKKLSTSFSNWG